MSINRNSFNSIFGGAVAKGTTARKFAPKANFPSASPQVESAVLPKERSTMDRGMMEKAPEIEACTSHEVLSSGGVVEEDRHLLDTSFDAVDRNPENTFNSMGGVDYSHASSSPVRTTVGRQKQKLVTLGQAISVPIMVPLLVREIGSHNATPTLSRNASSKPSKGSVTFSENKIFVNPPVGSTQYKINSLDTHSSTTEAVKLGDSAGKKGGGKKRGLHEMDESHHNNSMKRNGLIVRQAENTKQQDNSTVYIKSIPRSRSERSHRQKGIAKGLLKDYSVLPEEFGKDTPYTLHTIYLKKSESGVGLKLKNMGGKAVVKVISPDFGKASSEEIKKNDVILAVNELDARTATFDAIIDKFRWVPKLGDWCGLGASRDQLTGAARTAPLPTTTEEDIVASYPIKLSRLEDTLCLLLARPQLNKQL